MRLGRTRNRLLTEGEGCLALAYAMTAVFGAGMGFITVARLSEGAILSRDFSHYENWIVLTGAIGAVTALFLAGDRVGQAGSKGHVKGGIATVWISTVGSIIAGTLALPIYGTMFGPLLFAGTMAEQPLLAALWIANLFGVHVLIGAWRRERDSLMHRPSTESRIRQARRPATISGRLSS